MLGFGDILIERSLVDSLGQFGSPASLSGFVDTSRTSFPFLAVELPFLAVLTDGFAPAIATRNGVLALECRGLDDSMKARSAGEL